MLRDFLVNVLSMEEAEADRAACRMEHGISKEVVDRLVAFAEFMEACPDAGAEWVRGFGYRCAKSHERSPEACGTCKRTRFAGKSTG